MDFRWEGTRRNVNLSTFMVRSLKTERCDFGGKIAQALEPFQNMDSTLVPLLQGTVNGELKLLQNRSKNRTGKVIQLLFIID